MLDWYKDELIERKKNKSKILIGLGDSFTQGQGACSIELWEKYNWDLGTSSEIDNHDLLKSSYENSWVNKICENYLTEYTPINLGMTGRGNRAAVKELYLHPDLQLEKSNEIIVVFMLTGMERFDFIDKEKSDARNINILIFSERRTAFDTDIPGLVARNCGRGHDGRHTRVFG